jgi:hypothetical protein
MIKTILLNDGALIEHYSDTNLVLIQNETGNKYDAPIDTMPCLYTYSETDELIQDEDVEEATITDYQEALSKMGVKV